MTDTPHTGQLRDRIAAALEHEDVNWGYNCGFSADLLRDDRTAAFVSAVLAVVQPELDQLRAELARVNDALRAAGIEYPAGAHGVRDLAAMANGRAEELATARAVGMREAAAMLRRYCPTHSTEDTCLMDCHCAGADEIDRDARAVSTPTDGCGCKTNVHPGHYPSCPTRDAAPTTQSAACPCRAPGQDGDGRVRYQARDGEFVNLPCRSHVDVPTA